MSRDIASIQLHSERWEWLGQWAVDMDAVVGDEVDKDGWEYSTSFSTFSIASRRRSSHSMDCVRRRRWLRTRVPVAGSVDERFRPLTVFWDVQVLQSGTRRVDVRSGLQVRNVMPFAVMFSLTGSAWEGTAEFGPVAEDQMFNVPLMRATATGITVRPACFPYAWSQQVACCLQTHDFSSVRDVHCEAQGLAGDEGGDLSPVCMRTLCCQKGKSIEVSMHPFVTIANRLPCDLQYSCISSDKRRDEGNLLAGSTCKLTNISLASLPNISFRLGEYMWSSPHTVDPLLSDPIRVDMLGSNGVVAVVLTMLVKTCPLTGVVEVCVFSKGMLCDRTGGLGVSIWARRGRSTRTEELTRSTFRPIAVDPSAPNPPVPRQRISSADKMRRRAAVRAAGRVSGRSRQSSIPVPVSVPENRNQSLSVDSTQNPSKVQGLTGQDKTLIAPQIPSVPGVALPSSLAEPAILCGVNTAAEGSVVSLDTSSASSLPIPLKIRRNSTEKSETRHSVESDTLVSDSDEDEDEDSVLSSDELSIFSSDEEGEREGKGEGAGVRESEGVDAEGVGAGAGSGSGRVQKAPHTIVREFTSQSSRPYEVVRVDVGDGVYTDRTNRWTHLPTQLRNQVCIRTPCDDKMTRVKKLMQFKVSIPSLVLVLVDMRGVKLPPKWLKEDGFRRIGDQAISRAIIRGNLEEIFYGVFGKYFGRGETVDLRGNWSRESISMYCVFVIAAPTEEEVVGPVSPLLYSPTATASAVEDDANIGVVCARKGHDDIRRVFEEVTFDRTYKRTNASRSWIEGGNGLSLFHAEEDVVSIGVKMGEVWGEEFSIDMASSPHRGSFEAVDWDTMRAYQLSYTVSYMPGLFCNTQLLTITPRYAQHSDQQHNLPNCNSTATLIFSSFFLLLTSFFYYFVLFTCFVFLSQFSF